MSLTNEDKQWITAQMEQALERSEERQAARLERVETTLLTEFQKWASPTEMRLRSHSAALRALDIQQEAAADALRDSLDRLKALEAKHPPGSAQ